MGHRTKGYILAIISACTYGMNPLFALPLYHAGMTADSVLFFRYLIAIPIVGLMILTRGRSFRITRKDLLLLMAMGLVMAFSSLGLFLSYNYMDAGIASTMLFIYPVMVAVIMSALFHERLSLFTIVCIVVALSGIALLYKGDGATSVSLTGLLLVIGSALAYAVYIVAINRTRLSRVATLTVTFYVLLFGLLLFAARLKIVAVITMPPAESWWLWGCVVALAVFPTAISFMCITSAIQYIGSTPTAILGALEPVTAVIFGVLVFGEVLTPRDIVGLIMIIAAVSGVVATPAINPSITRIRRMFPRLRRK